MRNGRACGRAGTPGENQKKRMLEMRSSVTGMKGALPTPCWTEEAARPELHSEKLPTPECRKKMNEHTEQNIQELHGDVKRSDVPGKQRKTKEGKEKKRRWMLEWLRAFPV